MFGLHVSIQGRVGQIGLVTELTAVVSAFNIVLAATFLLLPVISVKTVVVVIENHGIRVHDYVGRREHNR